VRRGRGGREYPGHDVIGGSLDGSLIGHGHRFSGQEAGLLEHCVLTVGRRVANAAPGPPVAAQVLTPQLIEGVVGRRRERKRASPDLR
jgi:hypothetical protein